MPTTILKRTRRSQRLTGVVKTNDTGKLIVGNNILPHAGMGACKLCSCQKFVPGGEYKPHSLTGHQPNPCGNCGHDVRSHA